MLNWLIRAKCNNALFVHLQVCLRVTQFKMQQGSAPKWSCPICSTSTSECIPSTTTSCGRQIWHVYSLLCSPWIRHHSSSISRAIEWTHIQAQVWLLPYLASGIDLELACSTRHCCCSKFLNVQSKWVFWKCAKLRFLIFRNNS